MPTEARKSTLKNFNTLGSVNEQNSYLCGLIAVLPIRRRRPRKNEVEANLRSATFVYKVRFRIDDSLKEVDVCKQAFMSIHGIKRKKLAILQNSLKMTGMAPKDRRGENKKHPRKLDNEIRGAVHEHIKSFKGRKSHYSVNDSKRLYLPDDLNIKKDV